MLCLSGFEVFSRWVPLQKYKQDRIYCCGKFDYYLPVSIMSLWLLIRIYTKSFLLPNNSHEDMQPTK